MSFDKQAPTWSAPGVEPPESKKQAGWQVNDKPPAAWLNWFMSLTAESLKELQQKAAEKSDITTINSEIDGLKQSGVDGKNRLETAIIAKEGTVSKQGQVATFEELDNGIHSIPTGTDTSDATAAAGDIISGKTAYGPSGKITGTIPDRGAGGTVTPGATDQTKAAGRYTTAITIKGVPVPADKVLTGTTIAGTGGTMPNLTGTRAATGTAQWPDGALAVYPEKGYQKGGVGDGEIKVSVAQLQAAEPNLSPGNILSGKRIYGVIGTLIEGRKFIQGSVTPNANGYYVIPVNGFTPSYGFMWQGDGSGDGSLNPVYMGAMPRNADGSPNLARESGPSVVVVDYAAYYTSNGFTQPNNVFFPGSVFLRTGGKFVGTAKYILFE